MNQYVNRVAISKIFIKLLDSKKLTDVKIVANCMLLVDDINSTLAENGDTHYQRFRYLPWLEMSFKKMSEFNFYVGFNTKEEVNRFILMSKNSTKYALENKIDLDNKLTENDLKNYLVIISNVEKDLKHL